MNTRTTSEPSEAAIVDEDAGVEGPALEQQDWEAMGTQETAADSVPENGDLRYDVDPSRDAPEEDDDNPYQESDEALPGDSDEAAIARSAASEGGR